jgi:hypothetical protein
MRVADGSGNGRRAVPRADGRRGAQTGGSVPEPLRPAIPLSALAALLAFPASGQAASVVVPTSTAVETVVPAGDTRDVSLSCAPPAVALSGAVTRMGADARLRRSVPGAGAGDWDFRFSARKGSRRVVEAELRCVRLRLPPGMSGARVAVRTRGRPGISIPRGQTESVAIPCGPGYQGTGHGFTVGSRGDVRVAAAIPTSRGWRFELENLGAREATAGLSARCLKREVSARRGGQLRQLRFQVARREFSDTADSRGELTFTHSCRPGEYSLATGSEVDPLDAIALVRSHAAGRRAASWTFARARAGDRVTTHLACLDRGSQFE